MTTTRRNFLAATGAGAAALAFSPVTRAQATVSLRLQGFLPATSHCHRAFEKMAGEIKEETKGRFVLSLLPVGGAVAATETLNAVANGILDGHYSSPAFFSARDPAFALLGDTGAAYNDIDTRDKWFPDGGAAITREVYDRYGLHYVGRLYWPPEHLVAKRALNGADDLKGLKIRVPPGLIAEVLARAGAAVVNLPGGEVFNALQSGVIDATDWASPGLNQEAGLYRTAKFSVNAAHSMGHTEVSIGRKRWEAVPAELKTLLERHVAKMNVELTKTLKSEDERALAALKEQGGQLVTWTPAEIGKLRQFTKRVQQEYGARNPLARKVYDSLYAHMSKVGLG
jgi:TRAP-type C4-dicarboxylate transport system substrate-binding protein